MRERDGTERERERERETERQSMRVHRDLSGTVLAYTKLY